MNLAALLIRAARARPDSLALACGLEPHSDYRTLAGRAAAIAGSLRAAGLEPGDRVAIAMKNCPRIHRAALRHLACGPLRRAGQMPACTPASFAWIFGNSGARLVAVTPDLADALAPVCDGLPDVERMLVAGEAEFRTLYEGERIGLADCRAHGQCPGCSYTSGTTGRPKGAALSHRNLMHCHARLFLRCGRHRRGRCGPASRAAQPRFGLLQHSLCRPREPPGGASRRVSTRRRYSS